MRKSGNDLPRCCHDGRRLRREFILDIFRLLSDERSHIGIRRPPLGAVGLDILDTVEDDVSEGFDLVCSHVVELRPRVDLNTICRSMTLYGTSCRPARENACRYSRESLTAWCPVGSPGTVWRHGGCPVRVCVGSTQSDRPALLAILGTTFALWQNIHHALGHGHSAE